MLRSIEQDDIVRGTQIVYVPLHIQQRCEKQDGSIDIDRLRQEIKLNGAQRGFVWSANERDPSAVFCRYVYEHDVQSNWPLRTVANSESTPKAFLLVTEGTSLALPDHIIKYRIEEIMQADERFREMLEGLAERNNL